MQMPAAGRMDDDGADWPSVKKMASEIADKPSALGFVAGGLRRASRDIAGEASDIRELERSDKKKDRIKAQMLKDRRTYGQ